ncbi:hypothetical protein PUN49_29760, partial [Pseudomonas extremaustralis]|uniref:hypothetical protein n=1 Tax=Pseudomonas extremaustralis TaxID=359110 RepID=UPI00240F6EC0
CPGILPNQEVFFRISLSTSFTVLPANPSRSIDPPARLFWTTPLNLLPATTSLSILAHFSPFG